MKSEVFLFFSLFFPPYEMLGVEEFVKSWIMGIASWRGRGMASGTVKTRNN